MYIKEPTAREIAVHKLYKDMGLTEDEYEEVCERMGRPPNVVETGIFGVMWSEHCSYKNSKRLLRLLPTEGKHVLQGPGEGAGVVDIGDGLAIVFKIESHNHPSAIAPFDGAATGVGGIVRDVFSMGARPVALLNALRFGELQEERVRHLFARVVEGIAHYGNEMAIPTVGGEAVFDQAYADNPLVNAMCVGVIRHEHIQSGTAEGAGNPVIYAGAKTGRDGIHGATSASEELSGGAEQARANVPAADPAMGKRVLEACLSLIGRGIVTGIQDMGAAGLTSSSAEMASKAETGMTLDLDRVPQREVGMTPYEIMLSETQERMLLVVQAGREDEAMAVFKEKGVPAAVIGRVTDDGHLRLRHQGEQVADVPVRALVDDAPVYEREARAPVYYKRQQARPSEMSALRTDDCGDALRRVLQMPTMASKRWAYEQYDQGEDTLVGPGSDAAVIRLTHTEKALAMATDGNGHYVYLDPRVGGAIAVAEAARNVVCAGAEPLALTNGLNFGNPEKPDIYWQLEECVKGMREACLALGTPVTGGNVSLYNETAGKAVYPTPIVGMVGLVHEREHVTQHAFTKEGDAVLLLGETHAEWGGSAWQILKEGKPSGRPPQLDLQKERTLQRVVLQAIQNGWAASAHDVADGGLAVALSEACMGRGFGADIALDTSLAPSELLFSESQSRVLLSVPEDKADLVIAFASEHGVPVQRIGQVTGKADAETSASLNVAINGEAVIQEDVEKLRELWEGAIPCHMRRSHTN